MKVDLRHFKLQIQAFFLLMICISGSAFGQTTGDYRTVSSGAWTTLATWERWDGGAWVTPTVAVTQGYPGENNVPQRAYIANGHAITLSTTPPNSAAITRLEFLTSLEVAATSLTLSANLTITGDVVTEESAGNNTIVVAANTLTCQQMRLTNLLGTDVSEINVTTGTVNLTNSGGNLQIQQTTAGGAKCIFRCTGAGNLNLRGTINGNGDLIAGSGTVTFSDTAAQAVPAYAYNNLTLTGATGVKTVATGATIVHTLNLSTAGAGTILFASPTNVRAISCPLGVAGGGGETWGPSAALPENVDPVFEATSSRVTVNGQNTDYRTVSGGTWESLTTWEQFNGTSWSAVSFVPGHTSATNGRVYIRNGHNITTNAAYTTASKITRLEFVGTTKTAVTTLTLGANLTVTGAVVTEESAGNNTIVVSTFTLSCQQMRLTNLLGTADVSEINVTTGQVTCSTGSLQLVQTALGAGKSIFRCTGAGNLNIFGTISGNGDVSAGTGRVTLNGTSAITVPANVFFNLTLSGSSVKTFTVGTPATSVTNNLTISGTASAGLPNGSNFNVLSLTFGSTAQQALPSTYGSTASAAGTKSDTSFSVASTGIVTANPPLGDYRSVANGNWSALSTWERWNGTAWVTPTSSSPEGWPGQYLLTSPLTSRVFINDNTTVTADVSIPFANRPKRLELVPVANNAVLNINGGVSLSVDGPVVLTSTGTLGNTGDSVLNVGSGSLTVGGPLRLNDTPGPDNDCIFRIGTGGSVTVSGTAPDVRMLGAANENLIIFDGAGTLTTNGATTVAFDGTGTFTAGTGTVIFNGAAQTVGAYSFNNVTLSGSGIKTINSTASIAGILTITGTAKARLTTNYTVPSLVISALIPSGQAANTYGSTISSAVIKSVLYDNYFDSTAGGTGILTVSSTTTVVTPTIGTYTYTGLPQGPNVATNSGTATSYTFSYSNNGGTPYGPTPTLPTNAGNYFVTVTVPADGIWPAGTSGAVGFSIAQRALTITANSPTKQFGSTFLTGSNSTLFTSSGLQNGETIASISISSSGAAAGAVVGSYTIIPSLAVGSGLFSAANYAIIYTNGTLTVAAPNTGNYRSKASGDWTTLSTWERWNGTAWADPTVGQGYPIQTANVVRIEILNGHNVTCGIAANSFTFRAQIIEVIAGASNTSLTFTSTNYFELNNGTITLSSSGGGNALLDVGNASIYTFNAVQLTKPTAGSGTCKIIISNGSLNSGTNITMSGTAAENSIEFVGAGTLTSSGGTISGGTISAGLGTVQYTSNTAQSIGGYTFNNLNLSSTALFIKTLNASTVIGGNLTVSGLAKVNLANAVYSVASLVLNTTGQTVGTYGGTGSTTAATLNGTYFDSNVTSGNITVSSNLPFVRATIGNYTYSGVANGPNVATNSGSGTTYTFSYTNNGGTTYGPTATRPTNVGNYLVTVSVAADGVWLANTSAAIAFKITPQALTITANNPTKQFGSTFVTGADSNLFTAVGVQNNEAITITINSIGAVSTAAVGTYDLVPSAATGVAFLASNYSITYTNGTLTVAAPAPGNYRSKASGDWTSLATWERWNGTAWAEPTVGEGYPIQTANVGRIEILNGHNVTCGIAANSSTFRTNRIEVVAGANSTSLTFTSSNYFELNSGVIALSSTGGGNAVFDVGNANIYTFNAVQLAAPTGGSGTCKVIINNGALNSGTNITMSGTASQNSVEFTGTGVLTSSGGTISGGTIVAGSGTVRYIATAAQSVGTYTFNNLTLSSTTTFTKTLNSGTVINGALIIENAAVASLSAGITYNVNSMVLGTNGAIAGLWGFDGSSGATNFSTTYFANTTGSVNVASPTPNISITVGTYTYTGLAQGPTVATNNGTGSSYTFSYVNASGTAAYGPSTTPPVNVGNYTVTVTVAADAPWAVRVSPTTAFSISRAALNITADNVSKPFNTTHTVGSNITAFTAVGLQNSETVGSITISSTGAVSSANLGTYNIIPSAATGGSFNASNYTITYTNGTLTVVQVSGDYRSKASGPWTTLTTWERWNGVSWIEPTALQGYPCQSSAPTRVDIVNGHNVTCSIGISGTNRPRRIEVAAAANTTSLTFTSSSYFEVNGNLVISAIGVGSAFININAAYVGVTGQVALGNTPSSTTDCEVVITTGALYVYGGNFAMSGAADENAVRLGSGFLSVTGTSEIIGGSIVPGTGTVEYSGANQNVGSYNFYDLVFTGSGTKTIAAATTITNLSIATGVEASLNTGTTYNIDTLSLNCGGTISGTFGATASGATNINNVFFSATTGLLNVATNSSVDPAPVITIVQPTCTTLTGTITVTSQKGGDRFSFDNGLTFQGSNVKNDCAVGIVNVVIEHRSGCLSPVTVATITSSTKIWTGVTSGSWNTATNWNPAGVPDDTNCIVIPDDADTSLTIDGTNYTASLNNLTVRNGAIVTVLAGNSLKVTGFINVNTGGTLLVENNANLVQVNNSAINTGNLIYQRTPPTTVIETDYIYWSSPVAGLILTEFAPQDYTGGTFYSFNSTTDSWTDLPGSSVMSPGLGYIMRGQKDNNNPFTVNAVFTGVPNNGTIAVPAGSNGNSVLLGNPYPSAISADSFLASNSATLEGTLYFWTHRTPIANNVYSADDYASYNGTGSVAASGGTAPTGNIAACQGFFATSRGTGDATFNNNMRLNGVNPISNSNFYKTKNENAVIDKHRVWLNLTNSKGAFKQLLVGYVADATNNFDSRFDGKSFDGNTYLDFYSINQSNNLVIQGRALPFDEDDVVPLGYRSAIAGEFAIDIDHVDGLLKNQTVFLQDKLTNTFMNLKISKYVFTTAIGTFNDRFVLHYTNKTLGTNDLSGNTNKILISVKNKQIKINSFAQMIDNVTIYDLLGREVYHKRKVSKNEFSVTNFASSNQTLIIKATLQNGITVTEKVIY